MAKRDAEGVPKKVYSSKLLQMKFMQRGARGNAIKVPTSDEVACSRAYFPVTLTTHHEYLKRAFSAPDSKCRRVTLRQDWVISLPYRSKHKRGNKHRIAPRDLCKPLVHRRYPSHENLEPYNRYHLQIIAQPQAKTLGCFCRLHRKMRQSKSRVKHNGLQIGRPRQVVRSFMKEIQVQGVVQEGLVSVVQLLQRPHR